VGKYLFQVSYTTEGLKGLLKEGGSSRAETIKSLTQGMGGKVEAFYFAFGKSDVYVIIDMPSNVDVAALALAVGASGAADINTVVLLTPDEVDAATKRKVAYRAPGA
jgi:uncharacterized protein with GYD domain